MAPESHTIFAKLGCYSHSTDLKPTVGIGWQGQKWTEHYLIRDVSRPKTGVTEDTLICETCGKKIDVRVHSRGRVLWGRALFLLAFFILSAFLINIVNLGSTIRLSLKSYDFLRELMLPVYFLLMLLALAYGFISLISAYIAELFLAVNFANKEDGHRLFRSKVKKQAKGLWYVALVFMGLYYGSFVLIWLDTRIFKTQLVWSALPGFRAVIGILYWPLINIFEQFELILGLLGLMALPILVAALILAMRLATGFNNSS